MPTVESNGASLYYRVDGAGPAVVFCHGRASTHLSWCQQVPHFRQSYTCVTYDLRGFGRSTDVPGDGGLHEHADDLERLLDELGLDTAYLVGQSMGGFGALRLALRSPSRVRALALTSSPAGIADPVVVDEVHASREAASGLPSEARVFRPDWSRTHAHLLHLWICQQESGPSYPPAFLSPLWDGGGPSPDELHEFNVPTLVLAADHDLSVPVAAARRMVELFPNAELAVARDSGHCIYWERPDFYNTTIADFFTRHP